MIQYELMGYLAIRGGMTIGVVTVLLAFFSLISNAMSEVVERYLDSQNRIAIIQKIKDFIDKKSYDDVIDEKEHIYEKIQNIKFKHCSFAYGSKEVLHNIDFEAESGKAYAIVGDSRSGKNYVGNLL